MRLHLSTPVKNEFGNSRPTEMQKKTVVIMNYFLKILIYFTI